MERICFFDSWACYSLVGRSVAAVSELCFVAEMAFGLVHVGKELHELAVEVRPAHVSGPITSRLYRCAVDRLHVSAIGASSF